MLNYQDNATSWINQIQSTSAIHNKRMAGLHAEQILPAELWFRCFQFFTPLELCFSVAPTCRFFSQLSSDDALWSHFAHPKWQLGQSPVTNSNYITQASSFDTWKSLWLAWIRHQARKYHAADYHSIKGPNHRPAHLLYDYLLKYVLVGNSQVGKSSILKRYGTFSCLICIPVTMSFVPAMPLGHLPQLSMPQSTLISRCVL